MWACIWATTSLNFFGKSVIVKQEGLLLECAFEIQTSDTVLVQSGAKIRNWLRKTGTWTSDVPMVVYYLLGMFGSFPRFNKRRTLYAMYRVRNQPAYDCDTVSLFFVFGDRAIWLHTAQLCKINNKIIRGDGQQRVSMAGPLQRQEAQRAYAVYRSCWVTSLRVSRMIFDSKINGHCTICGENTRTVVSLYLSNTFFCSFFTFQNNYNSLQTYKCGPRDLFRVTFNLDVICKSLCGCTSTILADWSNQANWIPHWASSWR